MWSRPLITNINGKWRQAQANTIVYACNAFDGNCSSNGTTEFNSILRIKDPLQRVSERAI